MINAAELAAMRPGAFLINTAREALVDEDALDAALASGHLGGVALDVFEQPDDGRRPRFLRHENVVLTPHIGGATHETLARGAEMIAAEIARFAAGEPLQHSVTGVAATE
jgi:D-3-phosphoglycerate dehydrogenase